MFDERDVVDYVHDRIEREARWRISGCLHSILITGFILVLLLGIGGFIAYKLWTGDYGTPQTRNAANGVSAPKRGAALSWDGSTPLSCAGNKHVQVHDVQATLAGQTAITASGNCQLRITNSTIEAKTAIKASGNAKVHIQGGSLRGDLVAGGLAAITVDGATVRGKRRKSGRAKITVR